jgi:hypothetical protein
VTASSPTGSAAAVSSITATGDFSQTNTCGTSIAAGGSCTVSVTFTPISTSSYTQTYVPANADDGDASTYWEGTNGAWPTTFTVNLGARTRG